MYERLEKLKDLADLTDNVFLKDQLEKLELEIQNELILTHNALV